MTKDYVARNIAKFTILGHKVKAIEEIFSDEYLNSNRFQSRCLRCCFDSGYPSYKGPCICHYIKCDSGMSGDVATHFELDE